MDTPSLCSLYVGDLSPTTDEAKLFEVFKPYGKINSIKVCRDVLTKTSLGYAYVNFENENCAMRAMDNLNHSALDGRCIRVMRSHRDPSLRKTGKGNVFIKNLDESITDRELHDTFLPFGEILSCKIPRPDLSRNYGYGFVHFVEEEAADRAIEMLNGKLIRGKCIFVGRFKFRSQGDCGSPGVEDDRAFLNCYVKHLHADETVESLQALFQRFGEITSAQIMRDHEGKSKCFGFVCFVSADSAAAAVSEMNGFMHRGKALYVSRAQRKLEREAVLSKQYEGVMNSDGSTNSAANLYVKNLSDAVTDDRLYEEFSGFGKITSAKVMTDEAGRSKGFGFVCFSTPQEAKTVLKANATMPKMIDDKPVFVALAQRKDVRKKLLSQQYNERLKSLQLCSTQPSPQPTTMPAPSLIVPQMPARTVMPMTRPFFQPQYAAHGIQPRPMARMVSYMPNTPRQDVYLQCATKPEPPTPFSKPGLSNEMVTSAPPQEQKQMLGELLFPFVHGYIPQHAGKVTGMLLEMAPDEIMRLLKSPESLKAKIDEAVAVLKQHDQDRGLAE